MNIIKRHWVAFGLGFALFVVMGWAVLGRSSQPIAYVDLKYLFDNFQYTKELRTDLIKVKGARQKLVDSMEFELKVLAKELDQKQDAALKRRFDVKMDDLVKYKRMVEEDDMSLTDQLDKKILTQMSQYVRDFGQDKGYSMIIGTEGGGNVMYAKKDLDISKQVLEYINKKFKGTHEK